MTESHLLNYVSVGNVACSLCSELRRCSKTIYGHSVCNRCVDQFASRRQMALLIDVLLWISVMVMMLGLLAVLALADAVPPDLHAVLLILTALVGLLSFLMKDGFAGHSPGKRLCNLRVLNDDTNQPIGFWLSFKRNGIVLVDPTPGFFDSVALGGFFFIPFVLGKGYRRGDRFARTRVIWKQYATSAVFTGGRNHCTECGYNLHGNTSGICPECGTPAVRD